MGQGFSTANNVAVYVDQPAYFSGDVVQGWVLLNCAEAIADATEVKVEVIGYEKTTWDEIADNPDYKSAQDNPDDAPGIVDQTVTRERQAQNEFFKVTMSLHRFSLDCKAGQYQFPFRIALPPSIPSTFFVQERESTQGPYTIRNLVAEIGYKVKAEVVRQGMLRINLRGSTDITVRQRLERPPAELVRQEEIAVASCCCAQRGSVTVRVRAVKDAYAAGETAELMLEVENGTDLGFSSVVAVLNRSVDLTAFPSSTGVAGYVNETRVAKHKCPALPPGASFKGETAQRLCLPLSPNLLPTTASALIRCSYTIGVELSAGALTNSPKLYVPLTIYIRPPPHEPYGTTPPDYWKPSVIGLPVDIALPGAPPLPPMPATMAK